MSAGVDVLLVNPGLTGAAAQRNSARCVAALILLAAGAVAQDSLPDLMAAGNAAYLKGEYETARQSFSRAWDMAHAGSEKIIRDLAALKGDMEQDRPLR